MNAPVQARHRKAAEIHAATKNDGDRVFFDVETRDRIAQALANQEAEIATAAELKARKLADLAADTLLTGDTQAASIAGQALGVAEFAQALRSGEWVQDGNDTPRCTCGTRIYHSHLEGCPLKVSKG